MPQPTSIEDLIAHAAQMPEGFFTHAGRDIANKAKPDDSRAAILAAAAFRLFRSSADFKLVLDHLTQMTHGRPIWMGELGLPRDQSIDYGFFREGQNAVISTLHQMIAKGERAAAAPQPVQPKRPDGASP